MAAATIYEAAKIANAYIRPAATRLATTYFLYIRMLKMAEAEKWAEIFGQFSEREPFVDPDRPNDERHPITPETIKAIIVGMQTFVDFIESSGLRDIILVTATNPVESI